MYPKVSVITVCYNAEEHIERTINSVLNQEYNNIEYIIVDGASTDNTISIINKCKSDIAFYFSEPDNGIYEAMNKGIKIATGDILYFLNSDDVFYDEYVIKNIVKMFQTNSDTELIYGPIIIKDPILNESFVQTHDQIEKSSFLYGAICQQGVFFKADTFKKCGLFNDNYKIVGDYEWILRAFYKYKIKRIYYRGILAVYTNRGMSASEKNWELHKKERQEAFFKYFNMFELYKFQLFYFLKNSKNISKMSLLKIACLKGSFLPFWFRK
jgi:glycosyltransferase involved in cell wall biosynthesis